MYQVSYQSSDKVIGWLGKDEFDDLDSLAQHLLTFEPAERFNKNRHGSYEIYYDTEGGGFDKVPQACMKMIKALVERYKADVGELQEDEYRRSMNSPQAARDFGGL